MASHMNKWSRFTQPHRLFGWRDILETWNYTNDMPVCVETLRFNLRRASHKNLPVSHFLDFVNWEQDGICWLLTEVLNASSYMNSEQRLEYLKEIVDHVYDLDARFISFPFAPTCTIRQYVRSMLEDYELDYVQMMPPLLPAVPSPPRQAAGRCCSRESRTCDCVKTEPEFIPVAPAAQAAPVARKMNYTPCKIGLNVIRAESKPDDIIRISNNFDGTFDIKYSDTNSDVDSITPSVPRDDVLKYLSNTLRLLTVDSEPFLSVQLFAPNAPTVMVPVGELTSQTRDLIYDTVECVMDNWPYSD